MAAELILHHMEREDAPPPFDRACPEPVEGLRAAGLTADDRGDGHGRRCALD